MKSIVIYGTRFGNTRQIAEAIAEALRTRGEAQLLPAEEAKTISTEGIDLLVFGGPTEVHRLTEPLAELLGQAPPNALRGKTVAAFDTRVRWARILSGSAASDIAHRLRALHARVIEAPESFFVEGRNNPKTGEHPVLEAGELQRATAWAFSLADLVATLKPAASRS